MEVADARCFSCQVERSITEGEGLGQRAEQHWERMNVETNYLLGSGRSSGDHLPRSLIGLGWHGATDAGADGTSRCREPGRI